jgi:hypothetical protein
MPIENSLSFLGLQTSPNNLGAGEKGALVVADNVTIRYPDVLEPRRGQASTGIALATPAAVTQTFFFDDKVFVHTAADKVQRLDTILELLGDYVAADPDYRLKTAIASQTLYMATDKGVMALEEATSTVPRLSGIAEPLKAATDVVLDTGSTTIPGFLLPEKAVAYRILFGYVDSHGALHLGPPSVKFTVKNVSTTTQASVKVTLSLLTAPTDVTGAIVEGTFVRLYRSVMADTEGATSGELYLVNETVIDTSAYTTDDVLSIADTARQEFAIQSAPLYTNATQGFLPNDPPPFARDIATWSEREWYANTEQPYSLTAQLIGVEGGGTPTLPATGIRIGDTVTVAGVVFTAASSNNVYTPAFRVVSSGTPESNISETLDNLAEIVNGYARFDPTTFKIRAYLEPVVFSDQLLNFKIRFQRPSVDSTVNTAFGVDYSVQQFSGVVVGPKLLGVQQVTTLVANQWKVDDFVQFRSTNPTLPRITAKVTTVVSPTVVRVTPVTVDVPTGYTLAYRLYGESVWTPDLSAGVAADNERRQNGLYYSLPDEPEAVSAANYLTVGTSGKAIRRIIPQRDRLLVFKDEGTYAVYGDFPYQVQLIDDTVAILAPDSATAIGSTVIVLTEDGIMAVSDGGIRMISRPIDSTLKPYWCSTYRATTATGAFGVAYESEKVFALFMPALGSLTDYTAKAYVYGLETDAWTTWSYPAARLCGRVDPFSDTAYYGLTATPYLVKDKNTSSTNDYSDYSGDIVSTVQWAATTLGSPYATKQAREIHLHYRDVRKPAGTTNLATYSVKTDILTTGQTIPAWATGATDLPSATTIGPAALPLQYRKLVPQEVQRATYYTLGLTATTNNAYWALNGYSIVFEGTSERTGTVR